MEQTQLAVSGGTQQGVIGAETVTIGSQTFIYNYYEKRLPEKSRPDVGTVPLPPCPYPGLAYFGPTEADVYFGRDQVIDRLVVALERQALTALVGASGSGKSSVVLAGLAPRLHSTGGWLFSHFRVGTELDRNPFLALSRALTPLYVTSDDDVERLANTRKLATALQDRTVTLRDVFADCRSRHKSRRILLIADQFEETFTLVQDEALRRHFIEVLLAGFPGSVDRPDICLVLTLRADFYGRALQHGLTDALQDRVVNLGPMSRRELQAAIFHPAKKHGVVFETGLIDTLLDAVASKPGTLPLLQFALRDMWGRQTKGTITWASYDAIGGVEGALAQRAEATFAALTQDGAERQTEMAFRRLFTRLVSPGEGREDTRRVAEHHELGEDAWSLAQTLAGEANRLVVTNAQAGSHETAEIVHEALIRHWPRMVAWLDRDRALHTWLRQIRPALELWLADRNDDAPLLRGSMLAQAQDWLYKRDDDLSAEERSYISSSLALKQKAEDKAEADRQAEIARQRDRAETAQKLANEQRRRAQIALAGIFAASLLTILAVWQWRNAETQRMQANSNAELALRGQSLYLSNLSKAQADQGNIDTALLLAFEALPKNLTTPERPITSEAIAALAHAEFIARRTQHIPAHVARTSTVSVAPDEEWFVSGGAEGGAGVWSLQADRFGTDIATLVESYSGSAINISTVSPDGKLVALASGSGKIGVWSSFDWTKPKITMNIGSTVTWFGFDHQGTRLIVADTKGSASIFTTTGRHIGLLSGHSDAITSGAIDSSGKYLVTGSRDGSICVWDIESRTLVRSVAVSSSEVWDLSVSQDSKFLLTGSNDGVTRLWNMSTGQVSREFRKLQGEITQVRFLNNDAQVMAISDQGAIAIWNISDEIETILGEGLAGAKLITVSRDGRVVAAVDRAGLLRVWDVVTGASRAHLKPNARVLNITIMPKTNRIVFGDFAGRTTVWNPFGDAASPSISNHSGLIAAFSPNQNIISVGAWDGKLRIMDISSNAVVSEFQEEQNPVSALVYPRCNTGPVAGWLSRTIRVFGQEKLDILHQMQVSGTPKQFLISPGCKLMAVILSDGRIELRDFPTGIIKHLLASQSAQTTVTAFSVDNLRLASGNAVGEIALWDLQSGQLIAKAGAHTDRAIYIGYTDEHVVSASWDGMVTFWSPENLTLKGSLPRRGGPISVATMDSSRNVLFLGTWDGKIEVWSLSSSHLLLDWKAHEGPVTALTYNERSKTILSGSGDLTSALWDSASGAQLANFPSQASQPVIQLGSSDDESWFMINAGGTTLQMMRGLTPIEQSINEGRLYLDPDRKLTDAERSAFSLQAKNATSDFKRRK